MDDENNPLKLNLSQSQHNTPESIQIALLYAILSFVYAQNEQLKDSINNTIQTLVTIQAAQLDLPLDEVKEIVDIWQNNTEEIYRLSQTYPTLANTTELVQLVTDSFNDEYYKALNVLLKMSKIKKEYKDSVGDTSVAFLTKANVLAAQQDAPQGVMEHILKSCAAQLGK